MSSTTEVTEAAPTTIVKAHEATTTPTAVFPEQPRHLTLPQADPCTVVIFGASGDLARRKLIPALYNLACEGCTGTHFHVLGIGRTTMSDEEFRQQMRDAAATAKDTRDFSEETWHGFAPRLTYMVGDPNDDVCCMNSPITLSACARRHWPAETSFFIYQRRRPWRYISSRA